MADVTILSPVAEITAEMPATEIQIYRSITALVADAQADMPAPAVPNNVIYAVVAQTTADMSTPDIPNIIIAVVTSATADMPIPSIPNNVIYATTASASIVALSPILIVNTIKLDYALKVINELSFSLKATKEISYALKVGGES